MVVCRCRKATKFYCFVHKAPVCGECMCLEEHQLCVVKTYAEWVIDGDYDKPSKCWSCLQELQETDATTRLGCLHILHTHCLEAHLRSFPPHTAPAGYVCPACPTQIWPLKCFKVGSPGIYSRLKHVLSQSGVTTLLGSDFGSLSNGHRGPPPPAFCSPPLISTANAVRTSADEGAPATSGAMGPSFQDILPGGLNDAPGEAIGATVSQGLLPEAEIPSGAGGNLASVTPHFSKVVVPTAQQLQNGATARKNSVRGDKYGPAAYLDCDDDDDDDGSDRKYTRRGPLHRQMMRTLMPFWSPALPGLPVTSPLHRDDRGSPAAEDLIDGRSRRRQRSTTIDSRKLLLWFAIMSCMATALLLYYRLAQGFGSSSTNDLAQEEEQ